jgi:multicomponent Na+:H+ antiporter subunit B
MRLRDGHNSELVDIVSRKLVPFVLLFGFYVISHGHLSPGGGFQGGVVLASGVMLLALSRGREPALRSFPVAGLRLVETLAFSVILAIGMVGLLAGKGFLGSFLPLGTPGQVPSAGFIFFLNLLIGLEVGVGVSLILFSLLRED